MGEPEAFTDPGGTGQAGLHACNPTFIPLFHVLQLIHLSAQRIYWLRLIRSDNVGGGIMAQTPLGTGGEPPAPT
jgi:hypothetical protein